MKPILKVVLIVLCSLNLINTNAETWNEPWQKEIIQKSDCLVLGEVLDADNKAVKVKVIKGFGDNKTADEITIDGFFLLTLTSSSGRGVHFNLEAGKKYYLFLKKNDTGNYSLPTPTSGYAYVDDEQNVIATYRHSYHQALVPQDIYELTYQNIWSYYKKKKYNSAIWSLERIGDKAYISKLKKMQNELSDEDGGFGGNIMDPRVGTYFPSPRGAVSSL